MQEPHIVAQVIAPTSARTLDKPWLLFEVNRDPWEMHNLVDDPGRKELVAQMDARLSAAMKQAGDSWTNRTTSGDVDLWLPGGSKQRSQNLGHAFPGQDTNAPATAHGQRNGKGKKKAARRVVEDDE